MLPARPLSEKPSEPIALHDRAMDNLRYIRETMERSTSFTAVSGVAGVWMGVFALVASWLTADAPPGRWLGIWMAAAALSAGVALWAMLRKGRDIGTPVLSGPGRKFVLGFSPPLAVGILLTAVLYRHGLFELLPGAWLLLYGTAVVTGGAYSVRSVPIMGMAFMSVGALALLVPSMGSILMAVGFGGLHIAFGLLIWRLHGG